MSKSQTHELWKKFKKKKIDIMRFTDIDVNFDVQYDGDQKPSKCAWELFLANFGELHI